MSHSSYPPFFVTTNMMFFFLLCSLFSLVFALPVVSPLRRDVWVPPVISPDSNTVWTTGGTYTVSWNTSSQPSQVTNPLGRVYLRINGLTQSTPLAEDFPLASGQVNVTVPANTTPSNEWEVVLFGDSGNFSPAFTINSS
ncbi:hypothetical protein V8E55_004732 [Tylopilus felleus]